MDVYREWNTLFYLDVLCMNDHGCLERTCSHLINDLMFEYPYNVQILWHGWLWLSIEKELSLLFECLCLNGYGRLERTCSHLINDLMYEYLYNAQILWHR